MKNAKKIWILILAVSTLISCSYEPEIGSKVTVYPILTLNGSSVITIKKGSNYTDPGATSSAGTVTSTGNVDTNTIGVYKINYSSANEDGFEATKTRTVIVLSASPSSIDLSGNWYRGTGLNVITRVSDREYICTNATGYTTGNANNLTMTFYNLDDTKLYAPFQENCSSTGISAESNIGTITGANSFKWVIYASAFFGTSVRSFTR